MKKLLISSLALIAFVIPSLAQVDHDFNLNDVTPSLTRGSLKVEQVPPAIVKAVKAQFDISKPMTWSKFPYAIKEYGFVYDKGASDVHPDRYVVNMETKPGNVLSAVYSATGDLIETQEVSKNIPVPQSVKDALLKSKYKDWAIVGDNEIIRFYHDHDKNNVEQHFRLTVEKDKVKRSISFNFQASAKN
jgi:hypothetical protein